METKETVKTGINSHPSFLNKIKKVSSTSDTNVAENRTTSISSPGKHVQDAKVTANNIIIPPTSPKSNRGAAQSGAVSPANANSAPVSTTEAGGTAVNTNLDGHTPQEQKTIKEYNSFGDKKIIQYIQKVRNGLAGKKELFYLKKTSDRMAKDLKELTGLDVSENKIALAPNTIEHIDKNHGINGKRDSSMADDADLSKIQYVLDNYDEVHLNPDKSRGYSLSNGKLAPMVVFEKRIDGSYYVVEAVSDASAKTNYIVSAFKKKAGATPYGNLGKIKETGHQPSDVQAPEITSENATDIPVSNSIIPPTPPKSNGTENVVFPQRAGMPNKAVVPGIVQTKSKQGSITWSETEQDAVSNPVNAFGKKWGIESRVVKPSVKTNVAAFVKDGKIYLNADLIDSYSGAVSKLAHEAAHIVEGSKYWAEMKKAAAQYYKAVVPDVTANDMKQFIAERYGELVELDEQGMISEMTSAFMEDVLSRNRYVGERAARILLEESPKGFKRVVEFLKDKVESLKAYMPVGSGLSQQQRYELQAAQRGLKNLERGLRAYRKGKVEVDRTANIKYNLDIPFSEATEKIEKGILKKSENPFVLVSKNTPAIFLTEKVGAQNRPVIISYESLYLAIRNSGELRGHYHSIGSNLMSKLPQILNDPELILRLKNGRLNVIVELPTSKGDKSVVSIELEAIKDINKSYKAYVTTRACSIA